MDRFAEFARASGHRRGRLIRTSDYPKRGYILTLLSHSPAIPVDLPGKGSELRSRSIRRLAVKDIENLAPAVETIDTLGAPPPGRLAIHPSHVIPTDVPETATTGCGRPDQRFEPAAVRYIKLGEN